MKLDYIVFSRLSVMNHSDQPSEFQLPIGVASFACLVCFAFIYLVARPAVLLLEVWWAEWLAYALIPVSVAFIILYRSCWHPEMVRAARTSCLVLLSCIIFCSDLVFIGILIATLCVFVGLGRGEPGH
ncbi:MAG: hypothetical protein WBW41_13820 [Verrucomicrobiia bacterium]